MKKIQFKAFSALLVCAVLLSGIGTGTLQTYASSSTTQDARTSSVVQPRADITEWFYKNIGGKLYKRLYNYTTEKWVGDWILVV